MSELKIDRHLYTTRPDPEGRLPKEMAVYDLLERMDIPFIRVDHEAAMTIEACQGVDELLGLEICKNLFLCNAQKTKFYLLLMPGDKQFKTKDLSKQIGSSRLSFAPAEYMEKYVGSYKRGIWACDGRRHHQGDKEERRDKNRLTRHKISDITFKT